MAPELRFCAACGEIQPIDGHWRELWVNTYGELKISPPWSELCRTDDPEAVLACGQLSALVLVERWLHTGNFDAAQAHIPQLQPALEGGSAQ